MQERVMIVGGTSGMGLAAARLLLSQGYEVTVTGRSAAKVALVEGAQGRVLDFTDQASVDQAFSQSGVLDHLVLVGSGAPARGLFRDVGTDRVQTAWDQKFMGYWRCLKAALPHLNPRGSVTLVTGGASRAAVPGASAMAGVNAAVQAWGLTLAKELAPLRINVLSPGFVDTPLHDWMAPDVKKQTLDRVGAAVPVGRVGQPGEIASAVLFLIQNGYASGVVLDIDGGGRWR